MAEYLEVHSPAGTSLFPLVGARVTIGSSGTNDLAIAGDTTMSRLHAVLEAYSSGWSIRDVGSRNGTFVNGQRIAGEVRLSHGDEARIGTTRMTYRSDANTSSGSQTLADTASPRPTLTARERDVLVALCQPLLAGGVFTEPASIRQIAADLVVSQAAVKQHLLRLYGKFGLPDEGERRRVLLANEVVNRGVVTLAELRAARDESG